MEARDHPPHPPGLQMQMQQLPAQPQAASSAMAAQPQSASSVGSFYHHLHGGGAGLFAQQQLPHQQYLQTHQPPPPPHPQAQQAEQQQRLQSPGVHNPLIPTALPSPAGMRHHSIPNPNPSPSPTPNPNPNASPNLNPCAGYPPETPSHMIPHSLNASTSPTTDMGVTVGMGSAIMLARSDSLKRKRGRPRKYTVDANGTPLPQSSPSPHLKKASRGSSKKSQLSNYGANGQCFVPHILNVQAGEDITSKIMLFLQQGPWAVCILSANGTISNASLRHAGIATNAVMYEGRFEILTMSGLFLLSEIGGTQQRTGGLSVSFTGTDGNVIGGKVAGLLIAASPIQVFLGTFFQEARKSPGKAGIPAEKLPDNEEQQSLPAAEQDLCGSMPDQSSNSVDGVDRDAVSHVMPLQSADWGGSHFDIDASHHNERI